MFLFHILLDVSTASAQVDTQLVISLIVFFLVLILLWVFYRPPEASESGPVSDVPYVPLPQPIKTASPEPILHPTKPPEDKPASSNVTVATTPASIAKNNPSPSSNQNQSQHKNKKKNKKKKK